MKFRILAFLATALAIPLTGCPSQNTTAALVTALGASVATLETIQGNTPLATQITTDTNAASQAVLNWKQGTPSQDVVQALNIVEADLNLIPIGPQNTAYVELAIGTVDSILALIPATPVAHARTAQRHVTLPNPPKTAKDFNKAWHAIQPAV